MKEKTVLCFGDSNTYGSNPETGIRHARHARYTGVLQNQLGIGWRVIEEGLRGRTTVFDDPIEQGKNGLKYLVPCLQSHEPIDCIVIMLGTNDTKERFSASAALIAAGMQRLITSVMQTLPEMPKQGIVIAAPAPIGSEYTKREIFSIFGPQCDVKSMLLAQEYSALAQQMGVGFFDCGQYVYPHPNDHVHLGKAAHMTLGIELAKYILAGFGGK